MIGRPLFEHPPGKRFAVLLAFSSLGNSDTGRRHDTLMPSGAWARLVAAAMNRLSGPQPERHERILKGYRPRGVAVCSIIMPCYLELMN